MTRRIECVAEETEEEQRTRTGQRMEEIREEIKRVKIRMERQEKTERKNNIVRGLRIQGGDANKLIKEFLKEKFNIEEGIVKISLGGEA